MLGSSEGPPPVVDLAAERRHGDFVRGIIRNGQVTACHDLSSGGLVLALAEMAMAATRGLSVSLSDQRGPTHALLFGEDQARYIIAVPADLADFLRASAESAGVPFRRLGTVGGDRLMVDDVVSIAVVDLVNASESWFPAFMS